MGAYTSSIAAPTDGFDRHMVGAVEVGIVVSMVLHGVIIASSVSYFHNYERDVTYVRVVIGMLWRVFILNAFRPLTNFVLSDHHYRLLSTTHTGCLLWGLYQITILQLGEQLGFFVYPQTIPLSAALSALMQSIVQAVFTYRLYRFSRAIVIAGICWVLTIYELVGTFIYALNFPSKSVSDQGAYQVTYGWLVLSVLACAAVVDAVIAISIAVALHSGRSAAMGSTHTAVDKLETWTLRTGMLTSFLAIAVVVNFGMDRQNNVWLALYIGITNLYPLTLLTLFNGRRELRAQDQTDKEITVDRLRASGIITSAAANAYGRPRSNSHTSRISRVSSNATNTTRRSGYSGISGFSGGGGHHRAESFSLGTLNIRRSDEIVRSGRDSAFSLGHGRKDSLNSIRSGSGGVGGGVVLNRSSSLSLSPGGKSDHQGHGNSRNRASTIAEIGELDSVDMDKEVDEKERKIGVPISAHEAVAPARASAASPSPGLERGLFGCGLGPGYGGRYATGGGEGAAQATDGGVGELGRRGGREIEIHEHVEVVVHLDSLPPPPRGQSGHVRTGTGMRLPEWEREYERGWNSKSWIDKGTFAYESESEPESESNPVSESVCKSDPHLTSVVGVNTSTNNNTLAPISIRIGANVRGRPGLPVAGGRSHARTTTLVFTGPSVPRPKFKSLMIVVVIDISGTARDRASVMLGLRITSVIALPEMLGLPTGTPIQRVITTSIGRAIKAMITTVRIIIGLVIATDIALMTLRSLVGHHELGHENVYLGRDDDGPWLRLPPTPGFLRELEYTGSMDRGWLVDGEEGFERDGASIFGSEDGESTTVYEGASVRGRYGGGERDLEVGAGSGERWSRGAMGERR
ncbi:hypothetical protein AX16_002561 [Volvariella volvacea WC 439]|nr:hypothetical protein AX16_002561 [Volvariella volvacea WC 439]